MNTKSKILTIGFLVLGFLLLPSVTTQAFGQIQTIEIGFDQTIEFDNLKIHFSDIDVSRCPLVGECNGDDVTVLISIDKGTFYSTSYMIPKKSTSFVKPYEIRVMDIQPSHPHAEKSDYVVTLEIALTPTPEDEQACGKGNYLIDGVCHLGKQTGLTEEQNLFPISSILLWSIGAFINIGLITLITWNKRKTKNCSHDVSSIVGKTPVKEKHLRISAILTVVVIPVFLQLYSLSACPDAKCEPFNLANFDFVKIYFVGFSGSFLTVGLFGIIVSFVTMASGDLTLGYGLIYLLPWIILILVNHYSEKMSVLRILYWWILLTSTSFLLYVTVPFPLTAGPL